jgi:hypothetical protein
MKKFSKYVVLFVENNCTLSSFVKDLFPKLDEILKNDPLFKGSYSLYITVCVEDDYKMFVIDSLDVEHHTLESCLLNIVNRLEYEYHVGSGVMDVTVKYVLGRNSSSNIIYYDNKDGTFSERTLSTPAELEFPNALLKDIILNYIVGVNESR